MLDTYRLMIFLTAAETLNFSETARQLNVSQANVSHHIKMLEEELDVQLFDRSHARPQLTDPGRILLPRARILVQESIKIQEMMDSTKGNIHGNIRFACSTTAGKYILPLFAGRFRQHHPSVEIHILRCKAENVRDQLGSGKADLGVVSQEICGGPLECQEFFRDHNILIVPPNHSLSLRPSIKPEELLGVPFLIREPDSGINRLLGPELGKCGVSLKDLDIFLEIGSAEAITRAVASGIGIGFVSKISADHSLKCGSVVEVPIEGVNLIGRAFIVRRILNEPNRAVDAFWGFVHNPVNDDLLELTRA